MEKQDAKPVSESKISANMQDGLTLSEKYYRRLLIFYFSSISLVAIIPLVVMTIINYFQYEEAFHVEAKRPIARFTTDAKLSLEAFLSERVSALSLVIQTESFADLQNPEKLNQLLVKMTRSFGGFIDLGIIDNKGKQVSYAGPYKLQGMNYSEQAWFHEVDSQGVYISDVFLGHRHLPHFVIAVRSDKDKEHNFVLRATIDTDRIVHQIRSLSEDTTDDAFLVNRKGVLQTPSRFYGNVLETSTIPMLPISSKVEVLETQNAEGQPLVIGHASIEKSPFILMLLHQPKSLQEDWLSLRSNLIIFLVIREPDRF